MQDAYLETVARIEPDVTPLDRDGALASIAISLKRIADDLSFFATMAKAEIAKASVNSSSL